MIKRDLEPSLLKAAEGFPVVTLTGPRQSGKTTLVKAAFPVHGYCNLEHPEVRDLAKQDPKGFFSMYPEPLIIDEVQRVPELLSWIQVKVDETQQAGSYILTGSHQASLHEAISQSLAGRTALLRLLPFSFSELQPHTDEFDKAEMLHKGFMPRIYDHGLEPVDVYRNYYQTYVERDVRQIIRIKNLTLFERFVQLLAGRVGQTVNLNSLSGEVGVSSTTLQEWLSILEATYLIFRLPPYYQNFGKRLVKSPKLYFTEPGLAAWILGIGNPSQALRDPLHGSLFENMVVVDALKQRLHSGSDPNLYFWRDNNGNEVDLIWDRNRQLVPIEIKSSMTWHQDFPSRLKWMRKTIPATLPGYVVYAGELSPKTADYKAMHFSQLNQVFNPN